MTCSTKKVTASSSLAPFHVYSLLGVHDVQSTTSSRLRLLKIRNPYSKAHWNGRWSGKSPLWTPHLRRLLDFPAGGKNQVFCMELEDFVREFAHVTICRIATRDQGYEERRTILLPTGDVPCAGLTLEVTKSTECSLSLVQPNTRLRRGGVYCDLGEHLASIGLVLCCLDGPRTSLGGERGEAAVPLCRSDSVSIDCWLQPGRRYLLVPLSLHTGSAVNATAVCMSSGYVRIRERQLSRDVVREAWAACARTCDTQGAQFHGAVAHMGHANAGGGGGGSLLAFLENRSSLYCTMQLTIEGLGVRFSRSAAAQEGTTTSITCDSLPPGYGQILQVVQPNEDGQEVSYRWKHQFRMSTTAPGWDLHKPLLGLKHLDLHSPFRL